MFLNNKLFKIILFFLIVFSFNGCSNDKNEDKQIDQEIKKKSTSVKNKLLLEKIKTSKKSLTQTLKEDGATEFVSSDTKEEKMLNKFERAMLEADIKYGDIGCDSLAKTKLISKKDCENISNKYFSFYELFQLDNMSGLSDIKKDIDYLGEKKTSTQLTNEVAPSQMINTNLDTNINKKQNTPYIKEKLQEEKEKPQNKIYQDDYAPNNPNSQANDRPYSSSASSSGGGGSSGSGGTSGDTGVKSLQDCKDIRSQYVGLNSSVNSTKSYIEHLENKQNNDPDVDYSDSIAKAKEQLSQLETKKSTLEAQLAGCQG